MQLDSFHIEGNIIRNVLLHEASNELCSGGKWKL